MPGTCGMTLRWKSILSTTCKHCQHVAEISLMMTFSVCLYFNLASLSMLFKSYRDGGYCSRYWTATLEWPIARSWYSTPPSHISQSITGKPTTFPWSNILTLCAEYNFKSLVWPSRKLNPRPSTNQAGTLPLYATFAVLSLEKWYKASGIPKVLHA